MLTADNHLGNAVLKIILEVPFWYSFWKYYRLLWNSFCKCHCRDNHNWNALSATWYWKETVSRSSKIVLVLKIILNTLIGAIGSIDIICSQNTAIWFGNHIWSLKELAVTLSLPLFFSIHLSLWKCFIMQSHFKSAYSWPNYPIF